MGPTRGIRMHAIVGHSEIDAARGEEATAILVNGLLPGLQASAGFVSATFVRSADGATGHSMVVFESEEAARAVADTAGDRMPADAPITIVSLEVCEVAASG
jgi:hypothetical protein